jgi:hypothetical protein
MIRPRRARETEEARMQLESTSDESTPDESTPDELLSAARTARKQLDRERPVERTARRQIE